MINSNLSLHRRIKIDDKKLLEIYKYLEDFFGADFFIIETAHFNTIRLTAKDSPWIFQLLVNDDYGSIFQLFEIVYVLKETERYHVDLIKQLRSNSKRQGFRNYYFEALTYELLRINNIEHSGKEILDGKEREGFLTIGDTKFLFECKKLYSYQLPGLSFLSNMHEEFVSQWLKYPVAINSYITVKTKNEVALKSGKNLYKLAFREYFKKARETHQLNFEKQIVCAITNIQVGDVLIEPFHIGIFENQTELIHDNNVSFAVKPGRIELIDETQRQLHETHVVFKYEMMSSHTVEYLIGKIDKKRKSQKDLKHMPRIFFFDNEIYRGTEISLFQNENTFDGTLIQEYLESKDTDDIVCLIFRKYFLSKELSWSFKVFCKDSLSRYKEHIEKWITLHKLPIFSSQLPIPLV